MSFRAALLATCVLLASCPAVAQHAAANPKVERARLAIAQGDFETAERFLVSTSTDDAVDRNDLDFLRGSMAVARGDYAAAVDHFRAILARDPSLLRVRLDLARAFFLNGDDRDAERHFQIALGGDVPPEVRAKVEAFLEEIRRRKSWSVDFSVALAPDTNLNAATKAQQVDLFGIPFQLSDDARKKSGVGVNASLGGTYEAKMGPDTRFRVGARSTVTEYAGGDFDDRLVSAQAGPRFLMGKAEATALATAARRWYGGEGFASSYGLRAEGELQVSPRAFLSLSADGQRLEYDGDATRDGWQASLNGALTYGLTQDSFVRLFGGVRKEWTQADTLDNVEATLGAGYFREFPHGFGVYLQPKLSVVDYGARVDAFGKERRDLNLEVRASVSNRRIDVLGFTPVITLTHARRDSNVGLFDYTRNRVEIGVTRTF